MWRNEMNLVEIRDSELLGLDGKVTLLLLTIEDVFKAV